MYDIMINKNGSIYLDEGDIRGASYERYISQKLYAATMAMPPDMVNGTGLLSKSIIEQVLKQYYADYFSNDIDINPSQIELVLNESVPGEQSVSYVLKYTGRAPDGKMLEYTSSFDYSLTAGALSSVSYDQGYLRLLAYRDEYPVYEFIKITEKTNTVDLSVTPLMSEFLDAPEYPIMLLNPAVSPEYSETLLSFSIPTDGKRKLYQVDNYITGFNRNIHMLKSIESINLSDDSMDIRIIDQYGNIVIRTQSTGIINGTVLIASALQMTYDIQNDISYVPGSVFKLKPVNGKLNAVFPKTINPGEYVLKYTGFR